MDHFLRVFNIRLAMARRETEYRRLPGRGSKTRHFFSFATSPARSRLWLGKDHLLSVESQGYSEEYRHFYFGDIQAVITRRTARGAIWNIILGIFAAAGIAGTLLLFVYEIDQAATIMCGIFAGCMILALLINILRGPTCVCHIRTAVQQDELGSLSRFKTARRAINIIRPHIEEAQGHLTPEELEQAIATFSPSRALPESHAAAPGLRKRFEGRSHRILFRLLLCVAFAEIITIFWNHAAMTLLNSTLYMAAGVCVVLALVQQHQTGIMGKLRGISWCTLCYIAASFVAGFIQTIVITMSNPEVANNQWEFIKIAASQSPLDSPLLLSNQIFFAVAGLFLGLFGLLFLAEEKRKQRTPPPLVQPTEETPPEREG